MIRTERLLLEGREREADLREQRMLVSSWAVLALAIGLVVAAFLVLNGEMRRRRHAEQTITASHAEQAVLLELAELSQACRTSDESHQVIAKLASKLFEEEAGAIYRYRASRDLLEACATWGDGSLVPTPGLLAPDECWALRRGQVHEVDSTQGMPCKHVVEPPPRSTICCPLLAQGDVMGVLFLASRRKIPTDARRRASMVGEQISMALANMQLRETLRNQSIRDPLTALFNRRYAEETLQRELYRAKRDKSSLGVLMIDVDHFKRFNDSFGHEAGDFVLKEIANLLTTYTRGGDVASRMGGEELLVMLPGSTLANSTSKADLLRERVSNLKLNFRGNSLGEVTMSIGVAVAPEHGDTTETILRAADAALYRAKAGGRNKVETAASGIHPSAS